MKVDNFDNDSTRRCDHPGVQNGRIKKRIELDNFDVNTLGYRAVG